MRAFSAISPSFEPTGAAAGDVGGVEVLFGEGFAFAHQFEDGFSELDAGEPGFIDAGASEDIGGAGVFADAGVAVAGEVGLAMLAGFEDGFGAPTAEFASFEETPEEGVLDEVLEVAVAGPDGGLHPGGDEDAGGDDAIGVDVEESEDFGFGVADGVIDGAGFEVDAFGEFDDEFHAEGPFVAFVAIGEPEDIVEAAGDGADGAIGDDGEGGADFGAIAGEDDAGDFAVFDEGFGDGGGGPDLGLTGHHDLLAGPLVELAEGHDVAVAFMEEIGDEGDVEGVVPDFGEGGEGLEGPVGGPHPGGAAGGALGVEQVNELFVADGGGHRDIGRVEIGEGLADGAGAGDDAGDTEGDVIGTFIADDLGGHAGEGLAFDSTLGEASGERGEEPAGGGAEADTENVGVGRFGIELRVFVHGRPLSSSGLVTFTSFTAGNRERRGS